MHLMIGCSYQSIKETLQQLHPTSEDVKLSVNTDKHAKRQKTLQYWCLVDSVAKLTSNMQNNTGGYGYC